jgi:HK97 family phage major capsid protein/HK97 family phage prohead protease
MSDKVQHRSVVIDQAVDVEHRTVTASVASETPIQMWSDWKEVLSHAPGAMRMGQRQKSLPLLLGHDPDRVVGVIDAIRQEDGRTYATMRFASDEEGEKAFTRVKDRILTNVSIGYRVFKRSEDEEQKITTATDWEIFEVSLVAMPADASVGVYRSLNQATEKEPLMGDKNQATAATAAQKETAPAVQVSENEVRAAERARIQEIETMCRQFNIDDNRRNDLINRGASVDEARAAIMDTLSAQRQAPAADSKRDFDIGMSEAERRRYSLVRALNAHMTGNWREAGLEREVSVELARRMGRDSNGFFMPTDLPMMREAGYYVGTPTQGGNLVKTDLLMGSFIDILRNKAAVMQLGATFLPGLVGKVEIPRQSGVSATQWIQETGTVTGSNATFDKVALDMKTIAAKSFVSRNMLRQVTMSVENFVRNELATSIALAIDLAALSGSGSGSEPKGLASQTGILTVEGGTNGAAITFDYLIDMETKVADANADGTSMAYLANAVTIGALKKIKDANNNYIWKPIVGASRNAIPGEVNGYPVARSNQARKNLTKGTSSGVCSEIFFGNWADLLIGEWGVLEILPNPYSAAAYDNGGLEIRALQSVDIAVRHPESFCRMADVLVNGTTPESVEDDVGG